MRVTHDLAASTTLEAVPSRQGGVSPTSPGEPPLRSGELIGRFEVRRAVGRGGMGQVYLARDTELGRSVALKLVRPDRLHAADADDFVREARITAQLNHPHIVQIHDIGRHGDFAYLALEYLDGESLRARQQRGPLSVDESLRILRAIAEALCHAHASGVVHCDLKPANVMLPSDGRVRVVDFGLAAVRSADEGAAALGGTADWMAPEQWSGGAVSDRTDVWALAVIAHELLTGAHPFGPCAGADERRRQVQGGAPRLRPADAAGVTDRLRAHLNGSFSADPQLRPTARDWFDALDHALTGAAAPPLDAPFCGLAAFDEAHAALFFGREADVDAFMERLREQPAVAIVGPSGVGKSSFLRAGVIPRLRARGGWTVLDLRPGVDPFGAVAHQLEAVVVERPEPAAVAELARALRERPHLLARRLATIAASQGRRVLVAIDQLEEVFTQGCPAAEVEAFLAMLSSLDDASEPLRITCTVRDDYFTRWVHAGAPFILRRLGGADLRRTITTPLERLGYRFDNPAIVDEMLAETGDALIDLPLLQFACRALWDARDQDRRLLLTSVYKDLGGVTGALAHHAEQVVDAMTAAEQRITRDLLGRLVVGTSARRIVVRDALLDGLPADAAVVLDRLVSARLLAQHRPAGTDGFSVELAHESLLVNWTQLHRWLEDTGEERRFLHELERATGIWEDLGAGEQGLWPEAKLSAARLQAEQLALSIPPRLQRFLVEGEAHHGRRRRRARVRRTVTVAAALAIAAVAVVVATLFRQQKLEAEAQAASLRLAAANLGRFKLVLRPFDWRGDRAVPVDAALFPELRITVYQAAANDPDLPGRQVAPELVRVTSPAPGTFVVEAPGGRAFLRIDGRGRAGESCASSWIRVASLPGYARRTSLKRLRLDVPTCAASADDMVPIPAGDFIYGGPGVPATKFPSYVQTERVVALDAFAIDRTEVSNARFAPFAAQAIVHAYDAPAYPADDVLPGASAPGSPVTSIDAFEAEAYCRFLGKRLPTDEEWTKAARGGRSLPEGDNPSPARLYPWAGGDRPCANLEGVEDGFDWVAPVESFACGASPYRVLNLAGNVQEWIARQGQTNPSNLRVVRGGGAFSPPAEEHGTTIYRNSRRAEDSDYTIGVRCVTRTGERQTPWQTH